MPYAFALILAGGVTFVGAALMELVGDESTCNDLNCKLLDSLHIVKSGNDTGDMYTASETQSPHSLLRQ